MSTAKVLCTGPEITKLCRPGVVRSVRLFAPLTLLTDVCASQIHKKSLK